MAEPPVVTEPAPAKINPLLRVLGPRSDDYHDIETVVLPITLADGVHVRLGDDLRLHVAGERAAHVPAGGENLALRAARALAAATGEVRGASILLSKRIPVAAGLGGGSADAAATLRALDRLWACGLGVAGLRAVAADVGSDVPALLDGRPVLASGRGERVVPVAMARTWWVLVTFRFGVSAADAYAWWDGTPGGDTSAVLEALRGGDVERAGPLLFDDLEHGVAARHPAVADARAKLLGAGAVGAVMTGSGPTVAGLARDAGHAEELGREVAGIVVSTIGGVR